MQELKSENVTNMPVDRAWKVAKNSDKIISKVLPQYFASSETLSGDGGAGTIRLVTLGSAVPGGAGTKVKERIDSVDDATKTMKYSTIEGGDPRYKDTKFTLKFSPGPHANTTHVSWTAHYTPVDPSLPPPEHLKEISEAVMRALEQYATEHPEFAA